eukprot:2305609-Pleurochrysis_carterae.AAC.5
MQIGEVVVTSWPASAPSGIASSQRENVHGVARGHARRHARLPREGICKWGPLQIPVWTRLPHTRTHTLYRVRVHLV